MRWLGQRRDVLGVDTETGGLDWWRNDLRTVQFGDEKQGWTIPFQTWGGLAQEALAKWDGLVVMHNAKFDMHFLTQNGFKFDRSKVHDTMIMSHLYDNDSSNALKSVTARYIDRQADSMQHLLNDAKTKNKWSWDTIPIDFPPYWWYASLDPILTSRLWSYLEPKVSQYRDAYDLELAALQVLFDAERRGVRIDQDHARNTSLGMRSACEALEVKARADFGIKRLGSDLQVIKRMEEDGVTFTRFTKSGRPSLDEEALTSIDHPLAGIVLRHRHWTKIAGTYLDNFIDLSDDEGILHPSIHPLGARTGRMSVSRPSLQNLERTADVRDAFIPRKKENLLFLIDYDQIEMRLMAHYAGSPNLVELFHDEVDPFTSMARTIYRDPDLQKSDPRRQITKNAAYAKIYGAGTFKFSETAEITMDEATEFMNDFDDSYPEVNAFISTLEYATRKRFHDEGKPYVETAFKRRLQIHDERKVYKLVNYLIQGTAAQVLKKKLVELDAAGLAEYFVLPVHDEFIFDVPRVEAEEVARETKKVIEEHDLFAVPLTADGKFAERWGQYYPEGEHKWIEDD